MPDGSSPYLLTDTLDSYQRRRYPNPFFDMARSFIPPSIKTLFSYCRIFYYRNEFLHCVIKKLVTYPITDIIIEDYKDATEKAVWEEIFKNTINLRKLLVEIGLGYNVFGNAVVSLNLKFRRYLICEKCKTKIPVEKVTDRKYVAFKYEGTCIEETCKWHNRNFGVEDVQMTHRDSLKVIQWAPERLEIIFDEYTGDADYFYTLPPTRKNDIKKGVLEVVDKTPILFLQAVEKNKKIKLDNNNIFHFKQPTLPEDDQGWGKPIILPAISLIYYMQTLRRGNEAIALEHVVPLRVLFPAATANNDPLTNMNLGVWRTEVEEQIKKWKIDPNHMMILPIPIGYQSIGGDAKALMPIQELRFLEETIINSLGIPVEFIKGGATWTGSSISLRIVENGFINYREELEQFMNHFLIPKIATILGYNPVKVRFQRLRMHDDAEYKQLIVGLNATNKVSDKTLVEEFGFDDQAEEKRKMEDIKEANKLKLEMAKGEAEAQSTMLIAQSKAQAQAEFAYLDEKSKIDENLFSEELAAEVSKNPNSQAFDPSVLIHMWAVEILTASPEDQRKMIEGMQKEMPLAATFVMKRVQLIQQNLMQAMPNLVEAQNNEADRQVKLEQIKAKKKDAHTAPKKGSV